MAGDDVHEYYEDDGKYFRCAEYMQQYYEYHEVEDQDEDAAGDQDKDKDNHNMKDGNPNQDKKKANKKLQE